MKASSGKVLIVFVTTPNRREAIRIAKTAVEKKLAACGNVVASVTSIFRWKEQVQNSREALLIMKTSARRYPALAKFVQSMHPYEVPEIIAVPIEKGLDQYLEWVLKETATH